MENRKNYNEIFNYYGNPGIFETIPLSFQHVVAMIAGCITPAIMVASAGGLSLEDSTLLIQMSLIGSGFTTLLMLYAIKGIGSKLPVIFGVSFAYVPTMIAICSQYGASYGNRDIVGVILGAQIIGAIVSILFGASLKYILPLFPPIVSGTVVLVIGLSLYPVAIRYMGGAGAVSLPGWGAWQNWVVGIATLVCGIILNHFGKGMYKLANVLFAMIFGYIISLFFGLVDISGVGSAGWISTIKPMHFGLHFEFSAIISIIILFIVTAIEGIGDMSSTTIGAMNRVPTDNELKGGIIGYGVTNVIGALFGCLPTATFSQNVGIVSTNKVINRKVFTIASIMIIVSGFIPKLSAFLSTIPYPVLGGATLSVFAAITMNGIRMITSQPLSARNASIVGISVAVGMGFTTVCAEAQAAGIEFMSKELLTAIGSSPVVLATIFAVLMNKFIPEKRRR
ncbi:MAG: uracil-xanthine permease family protein [Peptoniphilaceae bacterium]